MRKKSDMNYERTHVVKYVVYFTACECLIFPSLESQELANATLQPKTIFVPCRSDNGLQPFKMKDDVVELYPKCYSQRTPPSQ